MESKLEIEIIENYEPTQEEIIKYGAWLGLTLPDDEELLYIVRKGLKVPLPQQWKRCKTQEGDIYYFNSETGQSEHQHPCESHYKQLIREAKRLNWLKNVKPTSLLNCQMSTTNDLSSGLKETENALNIETLRNKTAKILSIPNNPELEMDFRATYSNYQTNSNLHDPLLMQAYQDYLKAYQQKTSLYFIYWDLYGKGIELVIYNTETRAKKSKILTPEKLDLGTCITLLPNGKLFCFGNNSCSGIAVLIDLNGVVEVLPCGTPCNDSSCIYFNSSVYCFGGNNNRYYLNLSNKFDLNQKRWIQLAPMPKDHNCSSIIFNGNILISGYLNRNLLLYSIDIDSFSTIPYEFPEHSRKILINSERLYLIEICGSIYECEIESYTNWKQIGASKIAGILSQVYCSYNKGGIYIGFITGWESFLDIYYYKFDLNKKLVSEC